MKCDFLLIHAPTVFDFRRRATLYGPISDVVPSTPIFEMYPVGFVTLSNYLSRRGFNVRIANLAMRMVRSRTFDPEAFLRRIRPRMFGLDLHWMPHIQGVIEVARLLKRLHPDIPIVLGGLSASYFHREILENYPEIDFVIRGDCAEEPLGDLLDAVKDGGDLSNIPNLTFRRRDSIVETELSFVPETLDRYPMDYRHMFRQAVSHRDIASYFPFRKWFAYPITAVLTCKGCVHNCVTCGGSAYAYKRIGNRTRTAFKDPELIASEVASITGYLNGPIFFLNDILMGGRDHFSRIMDALRPMKIKSEAMFEFFLPPPRDVLEELASTFSRFSIEISPESHDVSVRNAFGRPYDNSSLERFIQDASKTGCRRLDLFFMTGLPQQTMDSVLGTVQYCRSLLSSMEGNMRLVPFISPLAPFLDPGSMAFEHPEKHGYRLRCRTVEEHRQAMNAYSWMETLNYETLAMDRRTIAEATYRAAIGLSRLKTEYGLFKKSHTDRVIRHAEGEMHRLKIAGPFCNVPESPKSGRIFSFPGRSLKNGGGDSVSNKEDLNVPVGLIRLRLFNLLRLLLTNKGN
ncbi:MAG: TIGR04190 family B12-binding domain/radical SAM domain protein [Proteobacteria bacterium]|nr:TIGR04190 family B12-binding domain/radical SAM domain protein [Pseudomonadota bacterium]